MVHLYHTLRNSRISQMFALLFLLFRPFLALSYQQVPHTGTDTDIQIHLRTFRPNAYLLIERNRESERGRESWPSGGVWVSGSICVRRSSYSATPNNPSSSRSRDPSPHSLERNDRARLSRQKQHKIQARNERYKAEQPVLKFSKRPETTLPVTVPPPQIAFHFRRENDSNPLAIPTSASEV